MLKEFRQGVLKSLILLSLAAFLSAVLGGAPAFARSAKIVDVRILAVNDFHGQLTAGSKASGRPVLFPFVIKQVKAVLVAFIGAVLKDTASIVTAAGIEGRFERLN